MANVPFLTHPSFANVDRYEHSLGVAHLAWRWARSNRIPEDEACALTIAALYHDGATPAYGHLFEEYLHRFGFDHETALERILLGNSTEIPGREHGQIFLGLHCRLRDELPVPDSPSSPLTPLAISKLVGGHGALGRLIKGDMDLDNIDNVIRASSAMGLIHPRESIHPYAIVDSLTMDDGELRVRAGSGFLISSWSAMRRSLYDAILNNAHEFRAQTAFKWAIEECARSDDALQSSSAWCLTDPMLTFEHLRRQPFSRALVDRVRAGNPPELLFSAWLADLSPLLGIRSGEVTQALVNEISALCNMDVHVNYYLDKRERPIRLATDREKTLFGNDSLGNTTAHGRPARSTAGILGVVAVSRSERFQWERSTIHAGSLARRPFELDDVRLLLGRILGERPLHLSSSWIGTSRTSAQATLSLD